MNQHYIGMLPKRLTWLYEEKEAGKLSYESYGMNALLKLIDIPVSLLPPVFEKVELKIMEDLAEYCRQHVDQNFDFPADVFTPAQTPFEDRPQLEIELLEKYSPKYAELSNAIKEFAVSEKAKVSGT